MFKEFKEFAFKGNVLDLAVGVVLGAAFGAIVKSFVDDIINPLVGLVIGRTDLANMYFVLAEGKTPGPYVSLAAARAAGASAFAYGALLNAAVNFLIVALALFLFVKMANRLRREAEATTRPCPFCTTEIANEATRCPACTSEVEPVTS